MKRLSREALRIKPLAERENKLAIERMQVSADSVVGPLSADARATVAETIERIRGARSKGRPVMMTFGAHTIKNGLAPVLTELMTQGWLTHLATNGAGVIHDWEFAFQGKSSEDVRAYVAEGQFGIWEETGRFLNLAINAGAADGLGYGASVGRMIAEDGLALPELSELDARPDGGAADLAACMRAFSLSAGSMRVSHPWKAYSVQAAAYRLGIPFTSHPMFGHDIIYCHPMNCGAAIGRAAERDFLSFAHSVSQLEGGVYLSVGSAVMSPMVFEKSFSMAQNLAIQAGRRIRDHFLTVVDLAEAPWDWQQGEPPPEHPAYYLRYCKTFNRMGGTMRYACANNRDFLLALLQGLSG